MEIGQTTRGANRLEDLRTGPGISIHPVTHDPRCSPQELLVYANTRLEHVDERQLGAQD